MVNKIQIGTLESNYLKVSDLINPKLDISRKNVCLSNGENDSFEEECWDTICIKHDSHYLTEIFCRNRFGGDLGYQYMDGDLHGLHTSASYAPFNLFHIYPALEGQLNILFGNTAVVGGVGAGIHTDFRRTVDFYSKLMFDGQFGPMGGKSDIGWSLDAVMGARLSGLYFEGFLPITDSDTMPSYGISVGAIIDFGASSFKTGLGAGNRN